jgi:hypothetical protein
VPDFKAARKPPAEARMGQKGMKQAREPEDAQQEN